MPHRILVSDDSSYVILELTGDITRKTQMEYNIEAHEVGRRVGTKNFLVDATQARNVESISDNYHFAYEDLKSPGPAQLVDRGARVAILTAPGDHSHDFALTVMINGGFDIKHFEDREEAIRYLKNPNR